MSRRPPLLVIYARVMDATLRWLVSFLGLGGAGYYLDGKEIGMFSLMGGGVGAVLGFWIWIRLIKKLNEDMNSPFP